MGNPNRRAVGSNSLSSAKAPKNHPHPQVAPEAESAAASSAAITVPPPPPPPAQPEVKKSALRPDSAPFIPIVPNGKFNTFGVYVPQVVSGTYCKSCFHSLPSSACSACKCRSRHKWNICNSTSPGGHSHHATSTASPTAPPPPQTSSRRIYGYSRRIYGSNARSSSCSYYF
jgi:hypothetical protein